MKLMNVVKRGQVIASVVADSPRDAVFEALHQGVTGIFHVVDTGKHTVKDYRPTAGDRLISNWGRGPLTARILSVTTKTTHLERTNNAGNKRLVRFTLPTWFLRSPACGWKFDQQPAADAEPTSVL